jgi:hypothetical protein
MMFVIWYIFLCCCVGYAKIHVSTNVLQCVEYVLYIILPVGSGLN